MGDAPNGDAEGIRCAQDLGPAVDTEAAEVWRGLTKTQRFAMTEVAERRDGTLYVTSDHNYDAMTWVRLRKRGLLSKRGEPGESGAGHIFTDLGKRVAAYGRSQTGGAR